MNIFRPKIPPFPPCMRFPHKKVLRNLPPYLRIGVWGYRIWGEGDIPTQGIGTGGRGGFPGRTRSHSPSPTPVPSVPPDLRSHRLATDRLPFFPNRANQTALRNSSVLVHLRSSVATIRAFEHLHLRKLARHFRHRLPPPNVPDSGSDFRLAASLDPVDPLVLVVPTSGGGQCLSSESAMSEQDFPLTSRRFA